MPIAPTIPISKNNSNIISIDYIIIMGYYVKYKKQQKDIYAKNKNEHRIQKQIIQSYKRCI